MKKVFGVIALFAVGFNSFGQVATATMTNATVASASYAPGTGIGGKVLYQAVVTKVSGTVGGGIALQQSNDGVNWSNVVVTGITATDTLALSNVATQVKTWYADIPAAKMVRIRATGTGTMVATVKLYANYRYNAKP